MAEQKGAKEERREKEERNIHTYLEVDAIGGGGGFSASLRSLAHSGYAIMLWLLI